MSFVDVPQPKKDDTVSKARKAVQNKDEELKPDADPDMVDHKGEPKFPPSSPKLPAA